MAHLQQAKSVRRADLYSSASSSARSSPDPDLSALLLSRLNQAYDFGNDAAEVTKPIVDDVPTQEPLSKQQEEVEEEEVSFRLFSGPKAGVQKVRVRTPTPEIKDPGLVVKERGRGYYFTGDVEAEKRAELEVAAVSGEEIRRRAEAPWPGMGYAWKVTVIKDGVRAVRRLEGHLAVASDEGSETRKKGRKGKKTRIRLRTLAKARQAKEAELKLSAAEKEAADKEKRTRRNREKKVKKRLRDKAKKVAGQGGGEGMEDDAGCADDGE